MGVGLPFGALAALFIALPAAAEDAPICTDRPAKANAVCTVPAGSWQLESSLAGWSKSQQGGTKTTALTLGSSVVKFGLSDRSDLQIGVTSYVRVEVKAGRAKTHSSGFGDITLRYKHRLTDDHASVQVGVVPFFKLPTADRRVGNGKVESGLAVPISIATGNSISVVLGPELDLLADADGHGRHAAVVNLVNIGAPVGLGLTLSGELWTMTNFDPAGTDTLASADAAVAYALSGSTQIDLGANFGLNRHTPDTEIYLGLSMRF